MHDHISVVYYTLYNIRLTNQTSIACTYVKNVVPRAKWKKKKKKLKLENDEKIIARVCCVQIIGGSTYTYHVISCETYGFFQKRLDEQPKRTDIHVNSVYRLRILYIPTDYYSL